MMFLEESTTEETIFLTFKLAELPTSVRLIGLFMRTSLITSEVLPAAIPEINKKRCWLNGKNKTLEKKKTKWLLLFCAEDGGGEFTSFMVFQLPWTYKQFLTKETRTFQKRWTVWYEIFHYLGKIISQWVKKCCWPSHLWRLKNVMEKDVYRIKVELWPLWIVVSLEFDYIFVSLA